MPSLVQIYARSPWRLRVVWDVAGADQDLAAAYTLARDDGAGGAPGVAAAWAVDVLAFELALDRALSVGTRYLLSHTLGAEGLLGLPISRPEETPAEDLADPEAEAFGVDVDWLAGALAPGGDLPEVRGLAALRADLAALAVTAPGELFHRPDAGAGLPLRVHGPNTAAELDAARGSVKRAWSADDRVREVSLTAQAWTDGRVTLDASVRTVALPSETTDVQVRRG